MIHLLGIERLHSPPGALLATGSIYKQQQRDFPGYGKLVVQTSDSSDSEVDGERMCCPGRTKTTAATEVDKYGRSTHAQHSSKPKPKQLSAKKTPTPSKFPPRKVLHPLNLDGHSACGMDTSGSEPTPPATELKGIHSALLQQTELLKGLLNRVEKCENRMESVEKKFDTGPTSSSSCSTPSRKRRVPEEVRRETRRVYYMLQEEDENFKGWQFGHDITFKSPHNQKVRDQLVREVKGLNEYFIVQHIRDAAYRFYRSRHEEYSLQRREKHEEKQVNKRRHERLVRKLEERKAMLAKSKIEQCDKDKWSKIMVVSMMSSEESGEDGKDEVLIRRRLPWRAERVNHFFAKLDDSVRAEKSPQARRQMKPRVLGEASSSRAMPVGMGKWAVTSS